MAERKFDYENIATIYKNMQNITGNEADPNSIAGILHLADKDYQDMVGVSEEALFGDLGNQLLLDWENTSSNFPNFVTNFNNWATLVAQSAGEYSAFEQAVAGLKTSNPLGLTSGGITSNYIDTSFYKEYTDSHLEQYNTDLSNLQGLYELTGVEYAVSDSQSLLKRHKIVTGIVLGADVLGLLWGSLAASALIGAGGAGAAGEAASEVTDLVPLENAASGGSTALSVVDDVASAGARAVGQTGIVQGANGSTIFEVTNQGGTYLMNMTANGQTTTGTLANFINNVRSSVPGAATASVEEILAACGIYL